MRKSDKNLGNINKNNNLWKIHLKILYAVEYKEMLSNTGNWNSKYYKGKYQNCLSNVLENVSNLLQK